MGGGRRAADTEAYDASGVRTALAASNADLTTQQWLRYGGLLVMPSRAIESRQLYALLLYFLLLLPLLAGLFALSALVACSTSSELVVPLCASWIAASGALMFVLYSGGVGPFDCGMSEDVSAPNAGGQIEQVHRYLPARFSAGVGVALAVVCVQSLVCALLVSGEFNTLCALANTISVNDAPSFSTLWAQQSNEAGSLAPRADGSPTLLVNDGSGHSDSSSTRSFLAFRDGFIQTQMVRGLNVTDLGDSSVVASAPAGLQPTRMLLLAPIWVSSRDPFYARVVPVWACGSFSVVHDGSFESEHSSAAIVASWSALHRFGRTTNAFDRDYRWYQDLIATLLHDSSMKQMAGAPLLYWSDPSDLRESAIRSIYLYLVPSLLLSLFIWLGTGLVHARWYRSMIAEETAWEARAVQRRERNTVRIKAKEDDKAAAVEMEAEEIKNGEPTSGSEHKDEQRPASARGASAGVELVSLSRPFSPSSSQQQQSHQSSVISPSQHVHLPVAGSSSQISRTGSLSSATSTFLPAGSGGAGASRPASASVASLASPSASGAPSSSWWKSSRLFGPRSETNGGGVGAAVSSSSPVEAFAATSTQTQQPAPAQPSSAASPVATSPVPSTAASPGAKQRGGLRAQMAADHAAAAAAQAARSGIHSSGSPGAAHVTLHMDPADTLTASRPVPTPSPTASPPSTQRTPRGARAAPYNSVAAGRLRAVAAPGPGPVPASAVADASHDADEEDASGGSSARATAPDDTDLSERSDESLVRTVSMERNAGGMGLSNRSPRARAHVGDGAASAASHPFSSEEPETQRGTAWAPRAAAQR